MATKTPPISFDASGILNDSDLVASTELLAERSETEIGNIRAFPRKNELYYNIDLELYYQSINKFVAFLDIAENLGIALQNELSTQYGKTKVRFYKCDVTKDEDLFEIYDKIHQEFNGIDVIVNNAGIATEIPATYKKTIETNLTATVSSTYKALELMRVDHGGKGGTIVNVSSTAALYLLAPSIFAYSATKSAILHFSNSIGKEEYFNHTKVRVLTMCFGLTESAIWQKMETTDELVKAELVKATTRKMQSCEAAAKGLIHGYKNGESGSTWLIQHNEAMDISDDIKQAFDIMSSKIKINN